MLKYFFHNPIKGYDVPSDKATPLGKEYTVDMIYDTIGDEPGSFFGVISQDDEKAAAPYAVWLCILTEA